jgi:hypothetical protein
MGFEEVKRLLIQLLDRFLTNDANVQIDSRSEAS